MRDINRIILHCTATKEGAYVDVETITKWHKARQFSDIGYHYVIYLDGSINKGRKICTQGAHVRGENKDSIGVAYVGGLDEKGKAKDTMNVKQEMAFVRIVDSLRMVLGDLSIHGHNEYSKKTCPNFIVQDKFKFLKL
ncbi:N-acetylmuramoyl-L-alanine amidase [bacterium]|nr:N-acetylmuramoyl-L-alanine amidase [bacterium]